MRIRVEDISKTFGRGGAQSLAVDRVSLEVESGELFFLLGPSGCGKTTLLRIIAGLTSRGTVPRSSPTIMLLCRCDSRAKMA